MRLQTSARWFATALGAALVAVSQSSWAQATGKRVAFFDAGPTHPFVAALTKSFSDRAKELGMQVSVFDTPYDAALQSQQVDDAIARKFSLLAIMPVSEKSIVPALARAKAAGIPVLIVNNGVSKGADAYYDAYVGEDHYQLGKLAGESAKTALQTSGRTNAQVALITGVLSQSVAARRVEGFNDALKGTGIKVVATEDAQWDSVKSEQIAGQLFARFAPRGGLDAVYGMADNQAIAAMHAAQAVGIQSGPGKGQLVVVGSGCDQESLKAIKAGTMYASVLQAPVRTGKKAAEVAADRLNGKTLTKNDFLPVEAITKANADKWAAACTY